MRSAALAVARQRHSAVSWRGTCDESRTTTRQRQAALLDGRIRQEEIPRVQSPAEPESTKSASAASITINNDTMAWYIRNAEFSLENAPENEH